MRIDLHAHSTASDGTDQPPALVRAGAAAGLDVLAITDHDTTSGWGSAAAALPTGMTLVPGAEISCTADGVSLHVLAYLFDPTDPALAAELARTRDDRVPRAREMVRRLAADGYEISWEQVLSRRPDGGVVGRPHIADVLVGNGVVRDRDEAFAGMLHSRSAYYVSHYAADPVHVVRLVRAAGGVAVFAHPGAHRRGTTVSDDVIVTLAEAGLAALEVEHPDHDTPTRDRLRVLARDLGLLVTGSSDYHGTGKPQAIGAETTDPETYAALVAQASGTSPVSA